jgi:RimJ/RimL family protein N-acetyltransferase
VDWIVKSVADPEVPRWTRVPSPYTKEDAWAWIALAGSMAREGSAYHLIAADAETDEPLGSIGLEVHERPARHGEIGYWLAAAARGRGSATRAVQMLARWGIETLALPLVELHVLPANTRSIAVATRAGFRPVERRLEPFRGRVEEFSIYALNGSGAVPTNRPGP